MQTRRNRNKRLRLTDEEYIKNKIYIYNAKKNQNQIAIGDDGQAYLGTEEDVEQARQNRTPSNFEYVYGGTRRKRAKTSRRKYRKTRTRKA
jgi:hypothetical protein